MIRVMPHNAVGLIPVSLYSLFRDLVIADKMLKQQCRNTLENVFYKHLMVIGSDSLGHLQFYYKCLPVSAMTDMLLCVYAAIGN